MGISLVDRSVRYGAVVFAAWLLSLGTALAMPPIQHWQTTNGVRVYYVPAPELPMLDIRVVFAAGSVRDAGLPGLASMTNHMLDKGAAGLTANDLAARLEGLGAELGSGSLRDMAWVSLRSLSDAALLEPALEVLQQVLGQPDFNARDFERERERTLVSLREDEQSPSTIAEYRFYRALYGEHPYATRPVGNAASLQRMTIEDIRAFYEQYYVAGNAVIAIVGDADRKAAERLAERIAGALDDGKAAPAVPVVAALEGPFEERNFHPSTQTHVRMGAPGMRRGDPDYFPLYVGNHILGGGGLVSRLNEEIREKRGLSYSVYSYFSPMAQDGPYVFGLQTRNDQLGEALEVMRDTLKTFHEEGPTQEELVAARKNITGGFALRVDSNSKIVEYLAMIGFYGLPLDYLETFNAKVEAVTREQIRAAFRRRVPVSSMATVIVGGEK